MKVSEVTTPRPQCISPETTVTDAAVDMKAFDVGNLLVCENDQLIGTITDRDITIRVVAEGRNPNTSKVADVMSREIVYCFDDQDVEDAATIMKQSQIRRLPVLNQAMRLVGIVSLGDLATRTREADLAGKTLAGVSTQQKQ